MLSSSLRPRQLSTVCAVCARISSNATSSSSSSSSFRFPPSPPSTSKPNTTTRRYNATYAQSGKAITPDQENEIEKDRATEQVEVEKDQRIDHEQEKDYLEQLLDGFEPHLPQPTNSETIPLDSTQTSSQPDTSAPSLSTSTSPSDSTPSPSDEIPDHDSEATVPPLPSLEELMSKPLDTDGPTLSDLYSFQPRRFLIPSASSPDSHRQIYRRVWDTSYAKLNRAFSKRQLFQFTSYTREEGGLAMNVMEGEVANRLRMGTKGRKAKWWKSKKLEQMSKRELIQTILVGKWQMVDPDTVPSLSRGQEVTEAVPLSDRILFLLLSPNCPVIPKIASHLGIKVSFSRHPTTQILSLILNGSKSGVSSAKAEVESIDEISTMREVELPRNATELRPEVYQTISRLSKSFLEPGSKPNALRASATEPKALVRLERLLSNAFATDSIRRSAPLFASVPTSLPHLRYSLVPHQPLIPLSLLSSGGTTSFARLESLRLNDLDEEGEELKSQREMERWSSKMRLERSERVPIVFPNSEGGGKKNSHKSVLRSLFKPFGEEGQEGRKFELRAELGHLVMPLYRDGDGFGPTFEGRRGWRECKEWVEQRGKNELVWIPAAPKDQLQSTGVVTPLPSSSSPFSSLLTPFPSSSFPSDSDSDSPLTPEQVSSLSLYPTFTSLSLRRFIYYPTSPSSSGPPQRLELTFLTERPSARSLEGERTEKVQIKFVRESQVDVMLPTGEKDLRLKLRETREVAEEEVEVRQEDMPERLSQLEKKQGLSLFETLSLSPSQSPSILTYNSTPYTLHTSSLLRQTHSTPPADSKHMFEGMTHESGTNYLPEQSRIWNFEYLVKSGLGCREDVREGWTEVMDELEKKCGVAGGGK